MSGQQQQKQLKSQKNGLHIDPEGQFDAAPEKLGEDHVQKG
jgi:hypothetical protein